jgi:hypothetical protein
MWRHKWSRYGDDKELIDVGTRDGTNLEDCICPKYGNLKNYAEECPVHYAIDKVETPLERQRTSRLIG